MVEKLLDRDRNNALASFVDADGYATQPKLDENGNIKVVLDDMSIAVEATVNNITTFEDSNGVDIKPMLDVDGNIKTKDQNPIVHLVFADDTVDVSGSTVTVTGTLDVTGTVAVSNPTDVSLLATEDTLADMRVRQMTMDTNLADLQARGIALEAGGNLATIAGKDVAIETGGNLEAVKTKVASLVQDVNGYLQTLDMNPVVHLAFADDTVDVSGSAISATVTGNITIDNQFDGIVTNGGTFAVQQDKLAFATDTVDVSGSNITEANSADILAELVAGTTVTFGQEDVSDAPTLIAVENLNRATIMITNMGNNVCFLGSSAVLPITGGALLPGVTKSYDVTQEFYAICETGNTTRVSVEEA